MNLDQARQLPKSAILVALFLEEHGRQPIGRIADATGLSDASVYAALKAIQKLGHDPCIKHNDHVRTPQEVGADSSCPQNADNSPQAQLEAAGIWPGPAARLLALYGPERIAQQLAHHAARLAAGFKFRGAPAAYLYSAIVHDYAAPWSPPPGLQEARKGASTSDRDRVDPRAIQQEPSDDEKRQRLAWYARKRDPQLIEEGRRLAASWGMAMG